MSGDLRRGVLDTSVIIDLEVIDPARLPDISSISTVTLAELSTGPHVARDDATRAQRQQQLQHLESTVAALAFDARCARAFGPIYAAVVASGRKARGSRSLDLLIAATARAHDLPLYTRNAKDLRGLEGLVEVIEI